MNLRSAVLMVALLATATGCAHPSRSADSAADSDSDPVVDTNADTTDSDTTDPDTDADPDSDTAPECPLDIDDTAPVELIVLDLEQGCGRRVVEQHDATYWADWADHEFCGSCLDAASFALDADGRCILFDSLCDEDGSAFEDPWYAAGCSALYHAPGQEDPSDTPCCQVEGSWDGTMCPESE